MGLDGEFDPIVLLVELIVMGSVIAGLVYIIRSIMKKKKK